MVHAIVGMNWGDEGKGRMVDYFAERADMVIRFQGGDNAGHTVVNSHGKFAFHNFPSGICYPDVINVIASGSVINPESFLKEQDELRRAGLNADNIMLSDRAVLIMPYHLLLERLEEERLGDRKYGSTMSGIAPAYADKYAKKGILAGELIHPEYLRERLGGILEYKNLILQSCYGHAPLEFEPLFESLVENGKRLKPYITDVGPAVETALAKNQHIILEAQLGALRDIGHGIYPYTTSSSVLAGYAAASVPLPPGMITEVTGITKAYSTCVGAGPFVTELTGELGDKIREEGKEYGAKTGRPRRIGYFDAVATRYGAKLQGTHEMVITCLDVLSGIDRLKLCVEYEIGGKRHDRFPIYPNLIKAKPVYEELPGWSEDITAVREFDDLPENARSYVKRIEELVGVKAAYISVGPERADLIVR
jgi:adenylosuccinate synthase